MAFALLLTPATALAAGETLPVPYSPNVYEGVDGVQLYWINPPQGPYTGWIIQRAPAPDGPFTDVAEIAAPQTYSGWFDQNVATGETWSYRMVVLSGADRSEPSPVRTVTVPAAVEPGEHTAFSVDGPGAPATNIGLPTGGWNGGAVFRGPELSVTRTHAGEFSVKGTTTAASTQGARTVAFKIGSATAGGRLRGGQTYATTWDEWRGTLFAPVPHTSCADPTGSLTVDEAAFTAKGEPLVLAASFDWCGGLVHGQIRWHAHFDLGPNLMTSDKTRLSFEDSIVGRGPTSPRTVTFRNAGTDTQHLGQAAVVNHQRTTSADFAVTADTCSGTDVAPSQTCAVTVVATPTSAQRKTHWLVLADGTAAGRRAVEVTAVGLTTTVAPNVRVVPSFHAVTLAWRPTGGGGGTGTGATKYTVYRGEGDGQLASVAEIPVAKPIDFPTGIENELTWTDTTAVAGRTYRYEMTATNLAGESVRSTPVTGVPFGSGIFVSKPTPENDPDPETALDIAELAADGTLRRFTLSGDDDWPSLARNGSVFVYATANTADPDDFDLMVQHPGQRYGKVLTSDDSTADIEPAVSPDGTQVAFTRVLAGIPSIWIMPTTGGTAREVPGLGGHANPAWSPNGKLLAAVHVPFRGTPDSVVLAAPDGSHRRVIAGSETGRPVGDPSFSADGATLSLLVLDPDTSRVATIPTAGGTLTRLTGADTLAISQQWAPAGDRIVFTGLRVDAADEPLPSMLWSIPTAGGTPQALPGSQDDMFFELAIAEPPAPYVPVVPAAPVVSATTTTSSAASATAVLSWTPAAHTEAVVVRRSAPGGPVPSSPEAGVAVYEGAATSATVTGLTPGASYRFAVFPVSPLLDTGAPGTVLVQPVAVPVVAPNGNVVSALIGSGPTFTASWGPDLSAGQRYEVEIGTRGSTRTYQQAQPTFRPFYSGTAGRRPVPAVSGTTYYLRARVWNAAGEISAWSRPAVAAVPYDDTVLRASGPWKTKKQAGHFGPSVRITNVPGSRLAFNVRGDGFALIADRCSTCGQVKIFVDGRRVGTVHTWAPRQELRRQVWTMRGSVGPGPHRVELVAAKYREGTTVRIDGLVVTR